MQNAALPATSPSVAGPVGRYRWVICALLFFATTINYVDRQVIGILKPTLSAEFGWSETDYADIVFWFQAAYAIGLLTAGRIIDKIGIKWGYAIAVAVWSFFGMAHAAASSVATFALARFGLGLGEAGNFERTGHRRDYAIPPPAPTLLNKLVDAGREVITIGKVADIYAHSGITQEIKADGNLALFDELLKQLIILINLALVL